MQSKTRVEIYRIFIEFIAYDIQVERHRVNRRMFNVFFWCFLLPTVSTLTALLLIKLRIIPRSARNHLDWFVLILPVIYSLYILGSEVLIQVPNAFRKGGVATTLGQAIQEAEWRNQVSEAMTKAVVASKDEWAWIVACFRMDLQAIQYRTRYLTVLAGSILFLMMHGIDALPEEDAKVAWTKATFIGWVETSMGDLSQYVALGLFLILLYLSGSQTYQTLNRYLNCADLALQKQPDKF